MEYTKLNYLLFKMGNLFNSKLFMIVVALVIIIGVTLFFVYDYKNDGPVLSRPNDHNEQKGKHSKKRNGKTEIWLAVIPVIILLVLFGTRMALSHASAPDTIVPSKTEKKVATGKVVWVNNSTGKVGITTKDRKDDNPIVARVNNIPVIPDTPLISSYAGTSISNKQFLSLTVGDNVKINVHPYEWLYKNHDEYGNDEHASHVISMLNQAKVNGEVIKIKADSHTKKNSNKNLKLNRAKAQNATYSSGLGY
ncbi:hypothetical protein BGL31_04905 [Fructilactobacillus lindneri]|uniref:hypothetical protein n=1 Tax=Fructilactobacillus lindneri TaxID=53444 RepID=UPI000CD49A64|nr:hypothetical protein [Fructilactobacillus lindneri]POG98041.1 hypothetical protein BGL31_04905 [Fructilactobacillus lindneri]